MPRNQTPLTERQLELLALVASGNTIDEAAQIAIMARQTAYNMLSQARTNARAKTVPHLVAIGLREKWIVSDGNGTVTVAADSQIAA